MTAIGCATTSKNQNGRTNLGSLNGIGSCCLTHKLFLLMGEDCERCGKLFSQRLRVLLDS